MSPLFADRHAFTAEKKDTFMLIWLEANDMYIIHSIQFAFLEQLTSGDRLPTYVTSNNNIIIKSAMQ